ncbi:hypothetical protein JZG80_07315 [Staphylococcus saprophyticus]|uniref:hypothetical protein n=1 Tax=Staphylococcus saprophyticus TaxID=29385 RepID=UPI0019814CD9|nr:hypothetical protein [Staphylococcus saprophyticus]MBN6092382.1 hypothetical protein [Staphylococcus saprophyticus]
MLDDTYCIEIEKLNGSYNYDSGYGLNIFVQHDEINDTDNKDIYFCSDYTIKQCSNEVNFCINYLLLELLNGIKISLGYRKFIPIYENAKMKNLKNHIKAYNIVSNMHVPIYEYSSNNKTEILLKEVINSQILKDLLILLHRVSIDNENILINSYKIYDFAKTYENLYRKHNKHNSSEISNLSASIKDLDSYSHLSNNYLSSGLVSRHGLTNHKPTNKEINALNILESSRKVVNELLKLNSIYENKFDFLLAISK